MSHSPMIADYPALYRDRFGEERTTIRNDGRMLSMVVRGVRFEGDDFDSFEAKGNRLDQAMLASFRFAHGCLCSCVIKADIPIPVVTPEGEVDGLLTFELDLGETLPSGRISHERLRVRLKIGDEMYESSGSSGWFEDELVEVQAKLPLGACMKACIACRYSDYSPYGHGLFGTMICFRANKAAYLAMPQGEDFEKDAYFAVIDTVSDMVQETYVCPEFERRVPGTGYRG